MARTENLAHSADRSGASSCGPIQQPTKTATIAILTGARLATKCWQPDPETGKPTVKSYSAGLWFSTALVTVSNIYELAAHLAKLEQQPRSLVVRGLPSSGVPLDCVRRAIHRYFKETDEEKIPWFRPEPQPWVMIDMDKIPMPEGFDIANDPEPVIRYVISLLPAAFHDVTCWWKFSSSAGMGDGSTISAHLWFWLDRTIPDTELRAWATQVNMQAAKKLIDPALFNPVQIHYTAAPIFDDGLPDPLPRRSGLLEGSSDIVTMPPIEIVTPPFRGKRTGKSHEAAGADQRSDAYTALSTVKGFEAKLALLGDPTPERPELQGFHQVLLSAVAAYISAS